MGDQEVGRVIEGVGLTNVRSFSHFLFSKHRIICWSGHLPKG